MKMISILKSAALLACLAFVACDKDHDDNTIVGLDLAAVSVWVNDAVSECGVCDAGQIPEYLCGKEWTLYTYALYESGSGWQTFVRCEVFQGQVLADGAGLSTFRFNKDGSRPLWTGTSPFPGAPKNPDPVEASWEYDVETGDIVLHTVYETGETTEISFYLRGLNSTMMILEQTSPADDPYEPFDHRMIFTTK